VHAGLWHDVQAAAINVAIVPSITRPNDSMSPPLSYLWVFHIPGKCRSHFL
jgi:hypothetical protein